LADSRYFRRWRAAGSVSFRLTPYWIGGAITAVIAVLFTKIFALSEQLAFRWATDHPHWAWVVIPLGLLASWGTAHLFSPVAVGAGIPQLIAALKSLPEDNRIANRLLEPMVIPVKIVATCLCVAGGGVTGREGPMLHVAGSIFQAIHKVWPRQIEFGRKLDQSSMVLAGGAAGLAAAFNTPLGGIVFAVEELAKVHLSQARTYIFHSVVIAGLLAQAVLGNYLYLDRIRAGDGSFTDLLRIIPVALIVGLLGGLFSKGIVLFGDLRAKFPGWKKVAMTILCGLAVAVFFSWRGLEALGSGREVIIELLRNPNREGAWALAIVRGFGNFFTFAGGVVGGIFAPALATGASLGAWLAPLFSDTNGQLFVLVGMVSFLTGVTQTPFTSCVLVLEMTDGHGVIFSLMTAAICSLGAAKLIDSHSFYEHASERWIKQARAKETLP
jgi:H+/Cl- antiporter ClcA